MECWGHFANTVKVSEGISIAHGTAGKDHIFVEVQDAVDFCREAMAGPGSHSLGAQDALRRTLSTPVQPHLTCLPINGYLPPAAIA